MFMLWPFKLAMKLVSLIFTVMLAYFVFSGVQVVLFSRLHQGTTHLRSASTIVLIGSSVNNNAASPDLQNRLTEALDCYQAHLAPTIIVTGANQAGAPTVANFEVAWLEQNGVPKSALQRALGSDTSAQLHMVAEVMNTNHSAIIVTNALDAFWTSKVAEHYGMTPQIAPAVNSEQAPYKHATTVLAQAGAVALGRIVGFNRIFWA